MSKEIVRPLSLLLCIIMTISLMIGCANKEDPTQATTPPTEESSSQTAETPAKDVEDTEGTPSSEGEVTADPNAPLETNAFGDYVPVVPAKTDLNIKMWWTQGQDLDTPDNTGKNVVREFVTEKTGVNVSEVFGNGGQEPPAKLTQMVAGDTLPDIVGMHMAWVPTLLARFREGGIAYELDLEMIKRYAPNLYAKTPKSYWDAIRLDDGKIYGIPYGVNLDDYNEYLSEIDKPLDPAYLNNFAIPRNNAYDTWAPCLIRDDVVKQFFPEAKSYDELQALLREKGELSGDDLCDIPITSTEDFVKFFYDIKALGLKEGNLDVYAYGYNGDDNWTGLSVLGPLMQGGVSYNYMSYFDAATATMRFGYLEDWCKEAAFIQYQMVRDRVIDPESLMHNKDQYEEKLRAGRYVMFTNWVFGSPEALNVILAEQGKPFKYRPFMTNVPQDPRLPAMKTIAGYQGAAAIFKSIPEEYLPQVLAYYDFYCTEEYFDAYYWGPPGAGLYTENSDGSRNFNDSRFQEHFLEGNSVLTREETLGLQDHDYRRITNSGGSVRHPQILNNIPKTTVGASVAFKMDSSRVTCIEVRPPYFMWDADYASPEFDAFWAERQSWDMPFMTPLAARNDEEFETRWQECIDNVKFYGLEAILEHMSKVAQPKWEEIKKQYGYKY